jgi:hypothetical protein
MFFRRFKKAFFEGQIVPFYFSLGAILVGAYYFSSYRSTSKTRQKLSQIDRKMQENSQRELEDPANSLSFYDTPLDKHSLTTSNLFRDIMDTSKIQFNFSPFNVNDQRNTNLYHSLSHSQSQIQGKDPLLETNASLSPYSDSSLPSSNRAEYLMAIDRAQQRTRNKAHSPKFEEE